MLIRMYIPEIAPGLLNPCMQLYATTDVCHVTQTKLLPNGLELIYSTPWKT
jgi:hypothetical protein